MYNCEILGNEVLDSLVGTSSFRHTTQATTSSPVVLLIHPMIPSMSSEQVTRH